MNRVAISLTRALTVVLTIVLSLPLAAAAPDAQAVRGFEQYVCLIERQIQEDVRPRGAFLWVDSLAAAEKTMAMTRLQEGQAIVERKVLPGAPPVRTPGAIIHHWVGLILIPGTTLQQVLTAVQDYDRHQEYYSPEVVKSRTLARNGDDFRIYLRLKKTRIATVVFDTEHEVSYHRLDPTRAYSESRSIRIAEIENPGEKTERELPDEESRGLLWRLNSYWRFVETQEGVYVECEAVSLTRDVPTGLGWLIGGFLESVPKDSLTFTLESTRNAVLSAFKVRTIPGGEK